MDLLLESLQQQQSRPTSPPDSDCSSPASILENTKTRGVDVGALQKLLNKKLCALSKTFGNIPGVPIFTQWETRQACCDAAVHRATRHGICGNRKDGAFSVVLSNGYEDDEDEGDVIIYTGSSHEDPEQHTRDQSWEWSRNKSLKVSADTEKPVRVIRSYQCPSQYAPLEGYRYDGLYKVVNCWTGKGRWGNKVCYSQLERLPNQRPIPLRPT